MYTNVTAVGERQVYTLVLTQHELHEVKSDQKAASKLDVAVSCTLESIRAVHGSVQYQILAGTAERNLL